MREIILGLMACAGLLSASCAAEALPEGVRVVAYKGWPESLIMAAAQNDLKAIVVPAIGGRIIHYGPEDANIIYEAPGSDGKTLATSKGWFYVGGYQCDLGPEIRGIPGHNALWLGQNTWRAPFPYTVTVASPSDEAVGVRIEKEIRLDPKTGGLTLVQRLRNTSTTAVSFCLWDRTLCKSGGYAFFELNKKSRFSRGWALSTGQKGEKAYDAASVVPPNSRVIDGVLVVKCDGKEGKLGADSDCGWIAYVRGRQLLVKVFPFDHDGLYSDGGNSVELFWSAQVAELEPLSPERKLKPGEQFDFVERWLMLALPEEATSFEAARALTLTAAAAAKALRDRAQ
ncbi:MAG: hypothetical protein NTW87_36335 [Planctomycetota bacterium]|nr:hypothetical protein [Planctomycetota bacterium]